MVASSDGKQISDVSDNKLYLNTHKQGHLNNLILSYKIESVLLHAFTLDITERSCGHKARQNMH